MVKVVGANSRSRKKINYNSYYNSNLRNNKFLERHPENRRAPYIQPVFAGAAIQSRETISSPFASSSSSFIHDLSKFYVIEETTNIELEAQSYEEIINEAEDGEIIAIEAVTNSPLVTIEIVIYGMGNSPNVINDYSINEMISRGRGLTPGDIETLPGGRSKDPAGIPRSSYPYVARYKADVLVDYLEQTRQTYVFVYEPSIPLPYSSIIVNVKNTSTESNKTVDSVNIHRRVYESPFVSNLVGTPIESAEIFRAAEEAEKKASQPPVPVVPRGVSPYVATYQQRQKQLIEAANAPELIPEEVY